jgi:hypothetical protein
LNVRLFDLVRITQGKPDASRLFFSFNNRQVSLASGLFVRYAAIDGLFFALSISST